MLLRSLLIAAALWLPATALDAQTAGAGDFRQSQILQLAQTNNATLAEQLAAAEITAAKAREALEAAERDASGIERAQRRLNLALRRLAKLRRQAGLEAETAPQQADQQDGDVQDTDKPRKRKQRRADQPLPAMPQVVLPVPETGQQPDDKHEIGPEDSRPNRRATDDGKPHEDDGKTDKTVVKRPDDRVIVKTEDGQIIIRHDEGRRFRRDARQVEERQRPNGNLVTVVTRPNGTKIETVTDPDGKIIRRVRRTPEGKVVVLIGGPDDYQDRRKSADQRAGFGRKSNFDRELPPVVVGIPRNRYVVESRRASRRAIEEAFNAPPVEYVERPYTLDEIRYSRRLRNKVRRVDLDTITFEFGSAEVPWSQINTLETIGQAIERVILNNPDEVFLIEGHTDAVGSDLANLELSDRRAESVAIILTDYFDLPPENLITQGYGEQFLKVFTPAPERENRRVTIRNLTPLLQGRFQR